MSTATTSRDELRELARIYPGSDGQPMAESTLQWDWIALIALNFKSIFRDRNDVAVMSDLLWYPIEGQPRICRAPDLYVAFGVANVARLSYLQWREKHIAPTLTTEVRSGSNTDREMEDKRDWYDRFGVDEYYVIEPFYPEGGSPLPLEGHAHGYLRRGGSLQRLATLDGHVSPSTGVRFDLSAGGVRLFRPDGSPFQRYDEIENQIDEAQRQQRAAQREQRAAQRQQQAAQRQQEEAQRRAEQLAAKLRELGIDPETV